MSSEASPAISSGSCWPSAKLVCIPEVTAQRNPQPGRTLGNRPGHLHSLERGKQAQRGDGPCGPGHTVKAEPGWDRIPEPEMCRPGFPTPAASEKRPVPGGALGSKVAPPPRRSWAVPDFRTRVFAPKGPAAPGPQASAGSSALRRVGQQMALQGLERQRPHPPTALGWTGMLWPCNRGSLPPARTGGPPTPVGIASLVWERESGLG